jgi:hypothetical protein
LECNFGGEKLEQKPVTTNQRPAVSENGKMEVTTVLKMLLSVTKYAYLPWDISIAASGIIIKL